MVEHKGGNDRVNSQKSESSIHVCAYLTFFSLVKVIKGIFQVDPLHEIWRKLNI